MNAIISRSLSLRILSALVLIPVVLLSVYLGGALFIALLALLFAVSVYEWFGLARKTPHFLFLLALGCLYLIIFTVSAYIVREDYGIAISVIFLSALWASDIGAYVAGKIIGGPKMVPTISPNKTWAGLCGAILFAVLTVFIVSQFFVTTSLLLFLSPLIALSGQLGDLMISRLKRMAAVKDTGDLIPGHGGLLDRIDSLIFATPVFLICLMGWM